MFLDTIHYEDEDIKFYLENGIFHAWYKTDELSLHVCKKMVFKRKELLKEFTPKEGLPALVYVDKYRASTTMTRNFLKSQEAEEGVKCVAIMATSLIIRIGYQFYMSRNKPNIPTRIFSNVENALEWLYKMKSQK